MWSLVLGIASFVVAPVIAGVAAIITGHRAKKVIRTAGGATKGGGMATAGQVLGWANIVVSIVVAVLVAVGVSYFSHHKEFTSLQPGDCFNGGTNGLTGLVHVVSCGSPHDNETIGAFVYPPQSTPWPGPAGFAAEAASQCQALASSYVTQATPPRLQLVWVYPGRTAWNTGTRKVVCAVRNADGTKRQGSVG